MRQCVFILPAIFAAAVLPWLPVEAQTADVGPITLADLNGVTIYSTVVHQQVLSRDGKEFSQQSRFDVTVSVKGDRVEGTIKPSGTTPRGPFHGAVQPIAATVNKPNASKNFGGGNGIWFLDGSTLTNVLVFKGGGAFRRNIALSRTTNGFACKTSEVFAREGGSGPINWRSTVDGGLLTLVSNRQISSSCSVKKG